MPLHRDPAPFLRVHVAAEPTKYQGLHDTPENATLIERFVNAAETFEIVNGRAVSVRAPEAGQPIPGVRYF